MRLLLPSLNEASFISLESTIPAPSSAAVMMMSFKGPGLLFLALLVSVLVLEASCDLKERYIHFLNQHRHNSNTHTGGRYCDQMMRKRGLASGTCKELNSFIHTSDTEIKAVCGDGGEDYGRGMRRSCKQFRVTTCSLRGGSTRPPCRYDHDNRPRYIVIPCEGGLPVHYDESKVIVDQNWPCAP